MNKSAMCASLLLALAAPLAAQQTATTSSHREAAAQMVELLKLKERTSGDIMGSMSGFLGSDNPMAKQMAEVMDGFMKEFAPWSKLEPEFVRVYQETFTEPELHELLLFYRSPIGQKLIEKEPAITQGTAKLMEALIMPNMPELQRRIMARIGGG